jgi:hypothetical protein
MEAVEQYKPTEAAPTGLERTNGREKIKPYNKEVVKQRPS